MDKQTALKLLKDLNMIINIDINIWGDFEQAEIEKDDFFRVLKNYIDIEDMKR